MIEAKSEEDAKEKLPEVETRELNRSKLELKVIATPIVVADNSFQALKINICTK